MCIMVQCAVFRRAEQNETEGYWVEDYYNVAVLTILYSPQREESGWETATFHGVKARKCLKVSGVVLVSYSSNLLNNNC